MWFVSLLNWNHLSDFYRLVPLLVVPWVLFSRSYPIPVRGLALIALSLQAVLLFYVPSGRYAYLAWLLVFLVFLVALRQSFLPWLARTYPESTQRLGAHCDQRRAAKKDLSSAEARASPKPPITSGAWWQVGCAKKRGPCSTAPPFGSAAPK